MCSTASTTMIASSTTMPIARTSARREMVLAENPSANMTAKVPTSATGTAMIGIKVARTPIIANEGVGRLRAEFGTGDVLDAHDPAIRGRADNDVVELLDRSQPPLRADVELEFYLGDERRCPDPADRGLSVLRVDRVD